MRSTIASLLAGLAATFVQAGPIIRRAPNITDVNILNYALTLEHLEATFYQQGLANFTQQDFANAGFADPAFYSNLQGVASDENLHVDFLTKAIQGVKAQPVAACTYNFPFTDVPTFIATANVLEGVGVSAYLGAAALIMDKTILTAAGSILTVEARHSSFLRSQAKEIPNPQPFDDPLDLNEVFTLAAGFIASCPLNNPPLPVKAFPPLAVSQKPAQQNSTITLMPGKGFSQRGGSVSAAFVSVTGPIIVPVQQAGSGFNVKIPAAVAGQSYVVLTSSATDVTDDTILAGPGVVEVISATTNGGNTVTASGNASSFTVDSTGGDVTIIVDEA